MRQKIKQLPSEAEINTDRNTIKTGGNDKPDRLCSYVKIFTNTKDGMHVFTGNN